MNGKVTGATTALLAEMAGAGRISGGCDQCSADQSVEAISAKVYLIHVFHSPDCLVLATTGNRAARRRAEAARRKSDRHPQHHQ